MEKIFEISNKRLTELSDFIWKSFDKSKQPQDVLIDIRDSKTLNDSEKIFSAYSFAIILESERNKHKDK